MNQELAARINRMVARDQEMRKRAKDDLDNKWDFEVDKENTTALKEIIAEYGWPTIEMVGEEASHNAWLLAQHADNDHEFQKQVLETLKSLYAKNPNSIKTSEIAYLTDRILVTEGREQEFGTQLFLNEEKKWILRPIRDPENVNKRREEYGLETIKEYLEHISNSRE